MWRWSNHPATAKHLRATGIDYSHSSVSKLPGRGLCASLEDLPFPGRSFDLVLCCEVLEHLPDEMFRRGLHELGRIARNHILISVRYKENLRLHRTRCSECGTMFHIWGHLRRFTNGSLKGLFEDFRVESPIPTDRSRCEQRYGNRWADWEKTSICPQGGNAEFRGRTPRNAVTIACGVVNLLTSWVVPALRKNWVLKCFVRHG
jgi:hypothetical protein